MPVREHFIGESRDAGDEKLAAEREKQWRMSGLLLEDEEVLRGMEREVAGVFIPAKLGKNGLDAKSSLAGKANMKFIRESRNPAVIRGQAKPVLAGFFLDLPGAGGDFRPGPGGAAGVQPGVFEDLPVDV